LDSNCFTDGDELEIAKPKKNKKIEIFMEETEQLAPKYFEDLTVAELRQMFTSVKKMHQ